MVYLKQSTAGQTIELGQFVSDTDGVTPATGLTIANTDIKLFKQGGTSQTSKNSGGATHIASGWYYATLDATDTGTLGNMSITVTVSGALSILLQCVVLAANIYDSLIGGGDILDVSMTQILGTAVSTPATAGILDTNVKNMNNVSATSITTINANQGTTQPVNFTGTGASALVKDDVTDWKGSAAPAMTGDAFARLGAPAGASVSADVAAIKSDSGAVKTQTDKMVFTVTNQIDSNVLDWKSSTAPAMTGDAYARLGAPAGASVSADVAAVKGDTVSILSKLLKYVQLILRKDTAIATDNATELTAINANGGSGAGAYDNTTDSEQAIRDRGDAAWITATGFSTLNATDVEDAVWDAAAASHVASGSTGEALNAAGGAGDPWTTALPGAYSSGQAGYIVGHNVDTTISSRTKPADTQAAVTLVATTTNLTNAPGAGDFTSAMKTSLNAATPSVTVSDKTDFSLSSAGIQALWDALTSALVTSGSIGKLLVDNINATISSRLALTSYTAPDNADIALIKAKTDNLPAAPAAVGNIPTAVQNADALLDRNMATGTDSGGRTVRNALRPLLNKVTIAGGTMTVTKENDTTAAWTAAVTTDATADPITEVDPV